MEKYIDILSKLLIATITFVGPMIVFCFGVFYDHLILSSKQRQERKKQIADRAFAQMSADEVNRAQIFEESSKSIKESNFQKVMGFLGSPKNQIIFIFSLLFISLGSLILNYLVQDNVWQLKKYFSEKFLIRSASIFYVGAIFFIICFVRNIIIMKGRVEKSKSA